jgi:hypothetical protein
MHTRIALLFAPLLLSACAHPVLPPGPGGRSAPPEIKLAGEDTRKQLGIAPDELLIAVRADGKIVLYNAPGLDFVRVEKEIPFDPAATNRVGLSVIPATQDACYSLTIGGSKYWFPKPPCPITY